jgi:hypothetical protein
LGIALPNVLTAAATARGEHSDHGFNDELELLRGGFRKMLLPRSPGYVIKLLILVFRDEIALLRVLARLFDPTTAAAAMASNTNAYSSKSWPDSSLWNWLTN